MLINKALNSNSAEFIENLTNELAGMVPTNPNRLKFIKYQSVSSTSSLLLFEILKPSNGDVEINVSQIADNLNVLIRNKAITGISRNEPTVFIDETYGFVLESKK